MDCHLQSEDAKRSLYLSLVRSQLQYCSPLWHPHLLSDIKSLETVQRRATKFIVRDKSMDYKDRLIRLHLLPLMMEFEISDIIFLVKSMKNRSPHFDVFNFLSQSSSLYYVTTFGITLFPISIHTILVPTTICVLVVAALNFLYVCYSLSSFVVCVLCVLYRSSG